MDREVEPEGRAAAQGPVGAEVQTAAEACGTPERPKAVVRVEVRVQVGVAAQDLAGAAEVAERAVGRGLGLEVVEVSEEEAEAAAPARAAERVSAEAAGPVQAAEVAAREAEAQAAVRALEVEEAQEGAEEPEAEGLAVVREPGADREPAVVAEV